VPASTIHRLPPDTGLKLTALTEPLAVACHDGGPIRVLISLVARWRGARVIVSEVNASRLAFARQLGLEVVGPAHIDLP
jgi:threonine dehydrogenase-like Zn-dependent dehydrogenase